jgi:DNA-binding MarR family transcriptional regulator
VSEQPSAVGRETKQRKPYRNLSQEGAIALGRTGSMINRYFARVVEGTGLSLAQYNVLRILRGAGIEGLPTMEIRQRLIDPAAGITRLTDKLERAGLVRRERAEGDRRQVRCLITRRGLELLAELDGPMDAADDAALGMLGVDEQRQLIDLLDRVRAWHLERDADGEAEDSAER